MTIANISHSSRSWPAVVAATAATIMSIVLVVSILSAIASRGIQVAEAIPMYTVDSHDYDKNSHRPADYAEIEKVIYHSGETVVVAGYITSDSTPMIKIINPKGAIYRIEALQVDSDDNFFIYNFTLGGKLGVPGKYKVEIKYHRSFVVGDSENNEKVLQGRFVLLPPHSYKVGVVDKLAISEKRLERRS